MLSIFFFILNGVLNVNNDTRLAAEPVIVHSTMAIFYNKYNEFDFVVGPQTRRHLIIKRNSKLLPQQLNGELIAFIRLYFFMHITSRSHYNSILQLTYNRLKHVFYNYINNCL